MAETSKTPSSPKKEQNPSKPLPNFLYKLIFVSVLIALLPIFPSSQSPELSNKTILTQTWELLHLLLVGIAISYGLFSRRNSDHEIEKETQVKPDATPESYVSQILQVSSVFDEEEIQSPKGLDFADEGKNHTWNYSQYYREEPVVMVAEESTNGGNSSCSKPLVLPVRSLKSRSQYSKSSDSSYEIDENDEDGKTGGKESAVLPSPIPWKSRSGRMEMKEESSSPPPPRSPFSSSFNAESDPPSRTPSFQSSGRHSPPNSPLDTELGSSRIQSFRSPTHHSPPNSAFDAELAPSRSTSFGSLSPKKVSPAKTSRSRSFQSTATDSPPNSAFDTELAPSRSTSFRSPTLSQEIRGKISEDFRRKKSFYESSPPPAPPPPPPPLIHAYYFHSEKRDAKKSFKDELEDISRRGKFQSENVGVGSSNAENDPYIARSVRTVRSKKPPPVPRNKSKKKDEFMEKMIISATDSETDDDDDSELSDAEETKSVPEEAVQEENEVDKKADEFIAKFREQIRLQRIASIKRSSGQRSSRNPK